VIGAGIPPAWLDRPMSVHGLSTLGVAISAWLLAFSMFLFLSLAFVKRYGEIGVIHRRSDEEVPGRAYIADDKAWMSNMGGTSGYLGILVFALYINSNEVAALYRHPEVLWFACPPLLYWINRTWLLAYRGKIDDVRPSSNISCDVRSGTNINRFLDH
jgi:4-hydroxybenzoate polyprenyltransferase